MSIEQGGEYSLYASFLPEVTATGNYDAQRQLDYRLVKNQQLRVTPPAADKSSVQAQGSQSRR